jgi:tetratricopeptide (TPR) repeat protein
MQQPPFMITTHLRAASGRKDGRTRKAQQLFDDEELFAREARAGAGDQEPAALHRRRKGLLARALDRSAAEVVASALRGYAAANEDCHPRVATVVRNMLETAVARADAEASPLGPNALSDALYARAYAGLHNCYAEEERWAEAEASARNGLAHMARLADRKALDTREKTLRADLETALAYDILSRDAHGLPVDRAAAAQPLLESALKVKTLDASPGTWHATVALLADCYVETGNLDRALDMYRMLLRLAPRTDMPTEETRYDRGLGQPPQWDAPKVKDIETRIALLTRHQRLVAPSRAQATAKGGGDAERAFAQPPGRNQIRDKRDVYVPLWMNAKALDGIFLLTSGTSQADRSDLTKSVAALEELSRCNPRLWHDDPMLASEVYSALFQARRKVSTLEVSPS